MGALIEVSADEFSAAATRDQTAIRAYLVGNADIAAIDAVGRLLTSIHADAEKHTTREVIVDLRELEFMNSSCFKGFVTWITRIQALDEPLRYAVRLLANPAMHWQRRSLHALRCLATDLITVDDRAPA